MTRKDFIHTTTLGAAAASLGAGTSAAQTNAPTPKKAVLISMLPRQMSYTDRFKLARDCGFEGVEAQTVGEEKVAEEIRAASEVAGLRIHSVMNMGHWQYPLSSEDPAVVAQCVQGIETSLRNAKLWKADTVLLVPAVVNSKTTYQQAYVRSQEQIRKLIPLAQELKVIIAVEEVWNKFLLSPLEFAKYVDEFKSPWVKAYFDVGNVVLFGYPQDWIRVLGKRIAKVHLKDFRVKGNQFEFVNLREGAIDWPEVRKAFAEIGYSGYITTELGGGDEAYLRDVSARFDKILAGE